MAEWLDSILPEGYAAALLWVAGALLLLVVILLIIRLARSLTSGTFISGGRNRRARLAVMDATPVDSKRRLVLIRRDDVEHLVLIGGTTDVVIERDIRMMPRSAKPATPQSAPLHEEPAAEAPRRAAGTGEAASGAHLAADALAPRGTATPGDADVGASRDAGPERQDRTGVQQIGRASLEAVSRFDGGRTEERSRGAGRGSCTRIAGVPGRTAGGHCCAYDRR